MLTIIFTILAIFNAILLLGLFRVIYYKNKELTEKQYITLDKIEDILVIALLTTITITIVLSVFLII